MLRKNTCKYNLIFILNSKVEFAQLQYNAKLIKFSLKQFHWGQIKYCVQYKGIENYHHVAGSFMCRQPQQKSGSKQPRSSQHQHHAEAQEPQPSYLE